MTHKEIADRLRTKVTDHYDAVRLANELDPPRPEPGTVVWWRDKDSHTRWWIGLATPTGVEDVDSTRGWDEIECKPARILGTDEVAVKVPPLKLWRDLQEIQVCAQAPNGVPFSEKVITRAEVERMEAEHGE